MHKHSPMFYKFDVYKKSNGKLSNNTRLTERDDKPTFSTLFKNKRFNALNRSMKIKEKQHSFQFETYDQINRTFEDYCQEFRETNFEKYFKQA